MHQNSNAVTILPLLGRLGDGNMTLSIKSLLAPEKHKVSSHARFASLPSQQTVILGG